MNQTFGHYWGFWLMEMMVTQHLPRVVPFDLECSAASFGIENICQEF
jgi:hypothetical protein